jgi:hypothetical protein
MVKGRYVDNSKLSHLQRKAPDSVSQPQEVCKDRGRIELIHVAAPREPGQVATDSDSGSVAVILSYSRAWQPTRLCLSEVNISRYSLVAVVKALRDKLH